MTDYQNQGLAEIVGLTMVSVTRSKTNWEDEVVFVADTGERWRMYYEQDCCASCDIEDITGDLSDLVGAPIAMAELVFSSTDPKDDYKESFTWSYYKFGTTKGYVTIRWYGASNGYYSETASFLRIKEHQ